MDTIIKYDEAAGYLKTPSSLELRPDFNNVPSNSIWSKQYPRCFAPKVQSTDGLDSRWTRPHIYYWRNCVCCHQQPRSHGKQSPMGGPNPATVKMIDTMFPCNKNYLLSYKTLRGRASGCSMQTLGHNTRFQTRDVGRYTFVYSGKLSSRSHSLHHFYCTHILSSLSIFCYF